MAASPGVAGFLAAGKQGGGEHLGTPYPEEPGMRAPGLEVWVEFHACNQLGLKSG